jgi:pimeloyl-ACP methyl ester carboxylesterase
MPRILPITLLLATALPAFPQPFDARPANTPDAATQKLINEQTARLRAAVARAVPGLLSVHRADVEIHLKAAEWIVRHQQWLTATSGKQTLAVIEEGIRRAESVSGGKTPWLDESRGAVARGYRSRIDGSVQPYGVVYPSGYGRDTRKKWRLDVHLHGRDSSLTEVKHLFLHAPKDAPPGQDFVQINIYGRGNNAYRWAGEEDVFEVIDHFLRTEQALGRKDLIDRRRLVLKGFSMGGAGTWHIGLRHPDRFAVLQPGAGFTTTHGYIARLPDPLPGHQEVCLSIYDAYRYAENAFNVPVVAYSGAKDRQKQAADIVASELEKLKLAGRMTHLIAPDLEHKFPAEWQKKADAEVRKRGGDAGRATSYRVRFVTYTLKTNECDWVTVHGLGRHYERARVDASRTPTHLTAETTNVTAVAFGPFPKAERPKTLTLDGQAVPLPDPAPDRLVLAALDGKWSIVNELPGATGKRPGVQGPIDDAFTGPFLCVVGTGKPHHQAMHQAALAQLDRFRLEWSKWMRGELPVKSDADVTRQELAEKNLILFGDPGSNSLMAKVLPRLPIQWSASALAFNAVQYDPTTHLPVLIHPSPFAPDRYVVLNSGHTFHEADFKGTNALLYPRLGDFALVRPVTTDRDPAAFEVVTAGLFDEQWRFPRK